MGKRFPVRGAEKRPDPAHGRDGAFSDGFT